MRRFACLLLVCLLPAALIALAPRAAAADDYGNDDGHHWGWYFAGKGGPSYSSLDSIGATQSGNSVNKTSSANAIGAFGMSAGYQWMYQYHIPLRTEVEFMNRTEVTYDVANLLSGGSTGALASTAQNITAMAKAYWYFPVGSPNWWPFVSAGVGWAHNTFKSYYTTASGTEKTRNTLDGLAWSAGLGATLKLGRNVMNDIELRYVDLGKADWGLPAAHNIDAGRFSAAEVVFAIRFMF